MKESKKLLINLKYANHFVNIFTPNKLILKFYSKWKGGTPTGLSPMTHQPQVIKFQLLCCSAWPKLASPVQRNFEIWDKANTKIGSHHHHHHHNNNNNNKHLTDFKITQEAEISYVSQEGVSRVFGRSLEGVWRVSGGCLEGIWRVSGGCLEGVWKVHGRCLNPK